MARSARRAHRLLMAVLPLVVPAAGLHAQVDELGRRCAQVAAGEALRFCNLVAQGVDLALPRLGLAMTGGNPVPGTASTLGTRPGGVPAATLAVRFTGVRAELPPIRAFGAQRTIDFVAPGLNVDGAAGLFGGFTPLPTVGGVGSLDALASLGLLPLPGAEGFRDGVRVSWALGARLGILRESFTVPGVSVSAAFRRLSRVEFGDPALQTDDAFFSAPLSIASFRGVIGKRIARIDATAGVGHERYGSDVEIAVRAPPPDGGEIRFAVDGYRTSRTSLFANVALTWLVVHGVAELGWQTGGDRITGQFPAGVAFDPERGAFFGGLAVRLSI